MYFSLHVTILIQRDSELVANGIDSKCGIRDFRLNDTNSRLHVVSQSCSQGAGAIVVMMTGFAEILIPRHAKQNLAELISKKFEHGIGKLSLRRLCFNITFMSYKVTHLCLAPSYRDSNMRNTINWFIRLIMLISRSLSKSTTFTESETLQSPTHFRMSPRVCY